jgi:hypothetical protein
MRKNLTEKLLAAAIQGDTIPRELRAQFDLRIDAALLIGTKD